MLDILLVAGGFVVLLALTQDLHIFPGAVVSLLTSRTRDPRTLPPHVESTFISTHDQKRLEVWRLAARQSPQDRVAIIFHGNGGTLETFFLFQLWLSELGITSYAFDYRGYGKSSGWPSEKGINIDADAVWSYVTGREKKESSKVLVLGFSIGSGPAARIAARHHPNILMLISPFTSLRRVVREHVLLAVMTPFLRHRFEVQAYVAQLKSTAVLWSMPLTII